MRTEPSERPDRSSLNQPIRESGPEGIPSLERKPAFIGYDKATTRALRSSAPELYRGTLPGGILVLRTRITASNRTRTSVVPTTPTIIGRHSSNAQNTTALGISISSAAPTVRT